MGAEYRQNIGNQAEISLFLRLRRPIPACTRTRRPERPYAQYIVPQARFDQYIVPSAAALCHAMPRAYYILCRDRAKTQHLVPSGVFGPQNALFDPSDGKVHPSDGKVQATPRWKSSPLRWKSSGAQAGGLQRFYECPAELDREARLNALLRLHSWIIAPLYLRIVGQGIQHLYLATRHAPRDE